MDKLLNEIVNEYKKHLHNNKKLRVVIQDNDKDVFYLFADKDNGKIGLASLDVEIVPTVCDETKFKVLFWFESKNEGNLQ